MNQSQHIDKVIERWNSRQIINNQLRLKISVDCICYLTCQACALRSHDEGPDFKSCGNSLELIKFVSTYSEKVPKLVFEKCKVYFSFYLERDFARFCKEVGDSKFCIIVDKSLRWILIVLMLIIHIAWLSAYN